MHARGWWRGDMWRGPLAQPACPMQRAFVSCTPWSRAAPLAGPEHPSKPDPGRPATDTPLPCVLCCAQPWQVPHNPSMRPVNTLMQDNTPFNSDSTYKAVGSESISWMYHIVGASSVQAAPEAALPARLFSLGPPSTVHANPHGRMHNVCLCCVPKPQDFGPKESNYKLVKPINAFEPNTARFDGGCARHTEAWPRAPACSRNGCVQPGLCQWRS